MSVLAKSFLTVILTLLCISVYSQSGIYYAETNYQKKITNYQIPCPSKFTSQELYDFYSKKYINLSSAEELKRFNKKEIWGYRDCKKFNYRILHNIHYKIVEDDAMVLYTVDYAVNSSYKQFLRGSVKKYYFSHDIKSPIMPLDENNLKRTYKDIPVFIQKLDAFLQSSGCIYCYDDHDKTYFVNELLKESLDKNSVL